MGFGVDITGAGLVSVDTEGMMKIFKCEKYCTRRYDRNEKFANIL